MVIVTCLPLVNWLTSYFSGPMAQPQGDVLIVLSAGNPQDGVLGYSSYLRAQYAIWAYRDRVAPRVVIAGGGGAHPAAQAMRDVLVANGVPREAITVESESRSTRENALNLRPILRSGRRLVLITSDYHMYRAQHVFQKLGITVQPMPIPDAGKRGATWSTRWPAFLDLCSESVKIAYYRLRSWI
jgi:uncharacterized SAM-binding protein YcdF (DUF218 family)